MNLRHTHVLSAIFAVGIACVPTLFMRCTDSPALATDAGTDVWFIQRPRDAYVAPDVPDIDAGLVCSPPPGSDGLVHDWPGWTRTTGLDKCCPADALDDLSKAVPYEWVPCEDGGLGCLRFNAPTSDISTVAPQVSARVVRGSTGAASQIFIVRRALNWGGYELSLYDFVTGQPKASWRFGDSPHCMGGVAAATDDSAMLALALFPTSFAPTAGIVVANGSVAALTQDPLGAPTGLPWNYFNVLYAGGRGAFAYLTRIGTCDMHTPRSLTCTKANVGSIAPAILNGYSEFFIEGEYVYALSTHGNLGWSQEYIVGPNGDVKLLRGIANAHVGALGSDGKNLTWVEVQGDMNLVSPQKVEEVWTAPLTSDPSQLAKTAKKIATLPKASSPSGGPSFNGYYFISAEQSVYIVRTSDGAFITAPALPAPYGGYGVFYITSTEVWVVGEHNSSTQLFRLTLPAWP